MVITIGSLIHHYDPMDWMELVGDGHSDTPPKPFGHQTSHTTPREAPGMQVF